MTCKIFHNPRCKKSRAGLDYLKSKTTQFVVRYYLDPPITPDEIREILLKSNLKPMEILRTQEQYFKTYLKGKNFTDDEWVKIISQNPKLIKRPIIVGKYKAIVGNCPELIDQLFK